MTTEHVCGRLAVIITLCFTMTGCHRAWEPVPPPAAKLSVAARIQESSLTLGGKPAAEVDEWTGILARGQDLKKKVVRLRIVAQLLIDQPK